MEEKNKLTIIKSLQIGTVCICSYMVSYYLRNLLSVTSPEMLSSGQYTKEFLGSLSSVYMLLYAIGQLINGVVGDIVKPKWMITAGTVLSGFASIAFAYTKSLTVQLALFALIGFSLSMLRGPLVKTISENTPPAHSRLICTFFSFASFTGPMIASLISIFFNWQNTFLIAGIIAVIVGLSVYLLFTAFEKKEKITYSYSKNSSGLKNIFKVFTLKYFVFYVFVGAMAEISSTSINFWIPSYLSEQLCFSEDLSKIIYSAMSVIKSVTPFITLFFFNLFNEKSIRMTRIAFSLAAVFFVIMRFVGNPFVNIVSLLLAQMAIGSASALLWSIYIPSQKESGMVSTINGVLDFTGYAFASLANLIFANSINHLGWNNIISVWAFMALAAAVVAFAVKDK